MTARLNQRYNWGQVPDPAWRRATESGMPWVGFRSVRIAAALSTGHKYPRTSCAKGCGMGARPRDLSASAARPVPDHLRGHRWRITVASAPIQLEGGKDR